MKNPVRFDNKIAVITGAGRGLGRHYALFLASRGARVVVNDLVGREGEDPAAEVVAEIQNAGGQAVSDHTDVSLADAGASIVRTAFDRFGRIDIVITNAGIAFKEHPFAETTRDGLMRMLDIHLGGTFSLVKAAWPHFVEQGYGRIITVSSAAGLYGQPGAVEYSTAKGAITGFSRALAQETAKTTDIKLNILSPAGVAGTNDDLDVDEATKAFMTKFLDPSLVAPGLALLAHEECPFNGRIFSIGGGHIGRVIVGETEGAWVADITPEAFSEQLEQIDSTDDLIVHEDAVSWGSWLAGPGMERRDLS